MRGKRVVFWLIVVLGLTLPVVLVALRTRPVRDEIRKNIEVAVEKELGLRAEIGDIDVHYLPPEVTARNVRLTHATEGPLLRAAHVRITPRMWGLANGRLEIDEIVVEAAALRIVVRDGAVVNGPVLRAPPEGADDEFRPPFRDLTLSDTSLTVESDAVASGRVRGIDLDVTADGDVLEARLRALDGEVRHEGGLEVLRSLELRVGLTPDAVLVRRLDVALSDVRVKAKDVRLARRGPLDLAGNVSVAGPLSVSRRLGLTDPVLQGDAHVTADVVLKGGAISADGRLTINRPQIDEFVIGDRAELPFHVDRNGLALTGGVVRAAGGEARIPSARVAFDDELTLDAEVTLHDLAFAEVLENLTLPNSHCEIAVVGGGGRFHGTLDPFRIESAGDTIIRGRDLRVTLSGWHDPARENVINVPSAELRTRLRFDPSGVRFRQSRLSYGRSVMRLEAHLRLRGDFEVHGQSDQIDLADTSPLVTFEMAGTGRLDFDITGRYSDPIITGRARVAGFAFHTFPFGDVDGDLRYRDRVISVENGHGVKGQTRFTVPSGQLDFRPATLAAKAVVQSDHLVLSEFYEVWHIEDDPSFAGVQGEAQGTAVIRSENGLLDVDFDALLHRVVAYGEPFDGGAVRGSWHWVDCQAGWRGGDVVLDELTLRKGNGTLSIDGATRRGGVLDLLVVADRIDLADVEHLPPSLAELRAVAGLHATLRGTPENPDIEGRASLSEARFGPTRFGASALQFRVQGPVVTARGDLAGGQIGLEVAARTTPGWPVAARVQLRSLALGWLLERAGVPGATRAQGFADGTLHVTRGLLARPDSLEGRLHLTRLEIAAGPYILASQGPVRVSFAQGALEVEQASFAGESTRFSVSGSTTRRGGLALRMDGELDLAFLQTIYPELEIVQGRLLVDGRLGGTTRRPLLFGSARVQNATLKARAYGDALEGISGQINFSQSRLLFEDFAARFGGGRVQMRGAVRLAGRALEGYALEVRLRDTLIRLDDEGTTAVLDGTAQLRWAQGDRLPTLAGDLDLLRLRYEREIRLLDPNQLSRRAQRAEVEQYDPALDLCALDLRLHGDDNLQVENNLLVGEFRIDESEGPLRLVGTDQRFGLLGELAMTRGTLRFRANDFDVIRGSIRFDDRTKIAPRFDITAESEVREWRVRIQALGTADEFRVFTTSEPELPEEDIALLLAFGVTRDELGDPESNAGQIVGQGALEALAAVTGVDREVRRVVPIDDIRIGSSYSSQSNRSEPTISIGKRLTNNVRVTATSGLGETRDVSANVEWRLNRNLSVEGALDNNYQQSNVGNVGLDLRFRLEFE